jgi:hypothetical protein
MVRASWRESDSQPVGPVRRSRSSLCLRAVVTSATLLVGCAAPMQGLRENGELPAFDTEKATVSYWMAETQALNVAYVDQYEQGIFWQPWLDLPIIGLAVGAVGSLLFGGSTQLTAALGLAAGGLTAIRAYADPHGTATDYLGGVAATECVISAGLPLQAAVADDGSLLPAEVSESAGDLERTRIDNAPFLAALPPDGSNEIQKSNFVEAQVSLRAADDAAANILAAYGEELNAARNSASILAATLARIKVAVARAIERTAPVFGQVQSDVAALVEQSGAQQQRLQTAKDLIAGRPTEEAEKALEFREEPLPINAATIRMRAALTTGQVNALRDRLPRVLAANANVAKCQPS